MSAGGAAAADDDEVGLDKEGRMLVWCLDKHQGFQCSANKFPVEFRIFS